MTDLGYDFEGVMLPLHGRVFARAMELSRNRSDAEDLTSTTFEKAWRYRHKFKPDTNARAWLLTICGNAWIDTCRRRQRQPETFTLLSPGANVGGDEDVIEYAAQSHDGCGLRSAEDEALALLPDQAVRDALSGMLPVFRQAVILVDIKGWSYREVAEHMGSPTGTVMSRLYRGRDLLKEALRDHYEETR